MEPGRVLIRVRNSQNLGFLEETTEERQRHRSTIVAESVWKNYRGMSGEIGCNEL
jgi:hypothetical protein